MLKKRIIAGAVVLTLSVVPLVAYAEELAVSPGVSPDVYALDANAPAQVTLVKTSSSFDAGRIFWKRVKCDGYEILLKENGSWRHAGWSAADKTNKLIRGLTKGKNYAFRVRAYNKVNGRKVFGKRSAPLRFRTKGYKHKVGGVTYIDNTLIVNKTYKLPKNYNPGGLTEQTNKAFNKMRSKASYDGIYLYCISGFRSYDTQAYLYNNYVYRDGQAAADRYSARPGYSEHQSGLALDVNNANSTFHYSTEAKWLAKHCADYGFIIRYPEGKESVTGYMYESWHIRYVGKTLAKKLMENDLTLEEYYGITSKYKE